MKEKRHLLYISELCGSQLFYIGKHSTSNINDGYCGSGKWVKSCLRKGRKFRVTIIGEFRSEHEAYKEERRMISFYRCLYGERVMNFHPGGRGGRGTGWHHSDKTKERIRLIKTGLRHSDEAKAKVSKHNLGKKWGQDFREKVSIALTGRRLSESHKNSISKCQTGRKHSLEHRRKVSESNKEWYVCMNTGLVFHGISQYADFWGISSGHVTNLLIGRKEQKKYKIARLYDK